MVSHEEETEPLVKKPVVKKEEAPSRREEADVVKEDGSVGRYKMAAVGEEDQPEQQQRFSSQHIHSIKTEYDKNPLLSINKPTSAPHNTPVQSPPASPSSATGKDKDGKVSAASAISQNISFSLPHLPPPSAPLSASRADISDGGTEPPIKDSDHMVSPKAGNAGGGGAGTEDKPQEDEDSPISIINRRNIFATSDSRSSSASKQVAGPPAKEILRTNSVEGSLSNVNSSSQGGVAPQSFYFDKDRSITDPHVKHESNDQKINLSNWRQGADSYSLMEGTSPNENVTVNDSSNSREGEEEGESGGRSRSNSRSSARCSETNGPAKISNGLSSSPNATNDDDNYVPPPPPRYINSKLDDIRSRLLLNPRTVSPRSDEDMDKTHAAAVLSNMRSSPFRLSDNRPASLSSSRPGSSSFSGKGYARPVVRIHHREEPSGDQDDNAVLDDDDDEEEEDEEEEESSTEKTKDASGSRVIPLPTSARRKEVTWNKNGKRVSRRLSAPETTRTKSKRAKIEPGRNSSIPRNGINGEEADDTYSSHEIIENEEEEEEEYEDNKNSNKGQSKKSSMGSRSRTGCWICRLRKKKCTEERPRCYNCDRLNLSCYYDVIKPDFVSNPQKKQMKLEEIKKKTKEAKRNAMRKKPGTNP